MSAATRGPYGVRKDARLSTGFGPRPQGPAGPVQRASGDALRQTSYGPPQQAPFDGIAICSKRRRNSGVMSQIPDFLKVQFVIPSKPIGSAEKRNWATPEGIEV